MEARLNRCSFLRLCGPSVIGASRLHARMPKLDVQPIDLLDQHQQGATNGSRLLTTGLTEPLAPTP